MNPRKARTGSAENMAAGDAPRADLGVLLLRSLDDHWQAFRRQLKRCQKKCSEAAVHDSRVASRRLVSILGILGRIAPDDRIRIVRRHSRKYRDMFDSLRDVQVESVSLGTMLPSFPELQAFQHYLAKHELRLLKRISNQLKGVKSGKLEKTVRAIGKELRALLGDPATPDGKRTIVIATVDAAFNQVLERRRLVDLTDMRTIHRMRVALKKFRYMVEALQPLFPGVTARQVQEMQAFQTMMGDIQDSEVLLADLARFFAKKKVADVSWRGVQEELSRTRLALLERFLHSADQLSSWWQHDRPPVTSKHPAKARRL